MKNRIDFQKIGKFLEQERLRRGYSLESVATTCLSPSTIYRLEKGSFKRIHKAIENYKKYCSLLELDWETVLQRIQVEHPNELQRRFQLLEISIDLKQSLEEDLSRLDELERFVLDSPFLHLLKAKAFFYLNRFKEAKKEAEHVIQLTQKDNPDNLRSTAFNILANCFYQKHDLASALTATEKGIAAFTGKARKDVYYMLLVNKVVYLERLGRLEEGQPELKELTRNIHFIATSKVACLVYEFQANLFLSHERFEDALHTAIEGLRLASRKDCYDQALELWRVLGQIYEAKQDWISAERAYQKALHLENKLTQVSPMITIYHRLAKLAMEQEKFEEAQRYLDQAFVYRNVYEGPRLLDAYECQGELYQQMGDLDKAIAVWEEGVAFAEKFPFSSQTKQMVSRILDGLNENDERYVPYLKRFFTLTKEESE